MRGCRVWIQATLARLDTTDMEPLMNTAISTLSVAHCIHRSYSACSHWLLLRLLQFCVQGGRMDLDAPKHFVQPLHDNPSKWTKQERYS